MVAGWPGRACRTGGHRTGGRPAGGHRESRPCCLVGARHAAAGTRAGGSAPLARRRGGGCGRGGAACHAALSADSARRSTARQRRHGEGVFRPAHPFAWRARDGRRGRRAVGQARRASCAAARRARAAADGAGARRQGGRPDRRATQRADRRPVRAGAKPGRAANSGRDGIAWHCDGRSRAVRDGRIRRQPDAPCLLACLVRDAIPGVLRHERGSWLRGGGHRAAAGQPAARQRDQADNARRPGRGRRQRQTRPGDRGDRGARRQCAAPGRGLEALPG